MSRMTEAAWQGEHGSRKMASYDIVCIHTIVGNAPAHAAHFSTDMVGGMYQSRDTQFQSAANLEGNPRVIAIENADMPPKWATNDGHAVPAFSASQAERIAQILAWCHKTHGIPLVLCPNSKPGSRGIAYHRQGVDGNFLSSGYKYGGRVPGGEKWSTSAGKVCPGDRRIDQLINIIIPRAIQLAGGTTPPPTPPTTVTGARAGMFAQIVTADNRITEAMIGTDSEVYIRNGANLLELLGATATSLGGTAKSVSLFLHNGSLVVASHGADDVIWYKVFGPDWKWTDWLSSKNIKLHT